MKRLTEIGIKCGTDKATRHKFTEYYDSIFETYTSPRILEIGTRNSNSINMFIEYFDKPYIVGMDIRDRSKLCNGDWRFIQGDQTKIKDLQNCISGSNQFDIILDDGGHTMKQQQITFGFLIDYLAPNGVYIIEDLHTSFSDKFKDTTNTHEITTVEMLKKIQRKELNFSSYINYEQQNNILNKIKNVDNVACKNGQIKNGYFPVYQPMELKGSITSVITLNC